jgi:hypothetical protein
MTKDEALKLALETLENSRVFVMSREMIKQPEGADWYDNRITAIKEALAPPTSGYAKKIEELIQERDALRALVQDENAIRADEREACAKVCEQVAVDYYTRIGREHEPYMRATAEDCARHIRARGQTEERNFCPRCGKRTADLTTIHTCTPPVAAGSQAFYGFPHGPVSSSNAGGKCVTAGETAPPKEIDPNKWAFDNGLEST